MVILYILLIVGTTPGMAWPSLDLSQGQSGHGVFDVWQAVDGLEPLARGTEAPFSITS